MFFDKMNRLRHSLAFRLTLWYALVFVISAIIVFVLFYLLITSVIRQRTDEDLLAQSKELANIYALQGVGMLQRSAKIQAQAAGEKKVFFRLFYPSGVVFAASNMSYWKNIGINRNAVDIVLSRHHQVYVTHNLADENYKVRVIYAHISNTIVLQLGYSLADETHLLQVFKRIFMLTMSGLLLLAMAIGWFMARRALSGVAMVTRTARQISEDDLRTRVPVRHRHDEIDRLAITFNQMLDRIQSLVVNTSQMNDNIAHDLRSPLTRIRGLAEVTLTDSRNMEEYTAMAASTIEECDRLLEMINTMLTISRTASRVNPDERSQLDLAIVVQHACELFQPLAEDKQVDFICEVQETAKIRGDERMLQRMVANLIDNAIKYTPCGGQIRINLNPGDHGQICLSVADSGMGISLDDQSKIFNRFFRGDQSRSQGGSGLGLSLARTVARSHGGEITLKSSPGIGSTFTVRLPASDAHRDVQT